jgi:hypothetical protein
MNHVSKKQVDYSSQQSHSDDIDDIYSEYETDEDYHTQHISFIIALTIFFVLFSSMFIAYYFRSYFY